MDKLKVIIADDHPIVLLGVRELVERDERFCVVGEAVCSKGLIELLEQQPVDLVITDYNMPADSPYGDGLKLVDYLKRHFPHLQVLILTMISNHLILTRLHELGVVGVIQKSQLHTEIQLALRPWPSKASTAAWNLQKPRSSKPPRRSRTGLPHCHPKSLKYCDCLSPVKVSVILPAARTEVPRPSARKRFRPCANLMLIATRTCWLIAWSAVSLTKFPGNKVRNR